jgi:S1-C subfamily serine protease
VRSDPVLKETLFGSSRPTTGLRLGPAPDGGKGVLVRSVMPGSLAEQAGLRAEDVVVAVDGERFDDVEGPGAVQMMTRVIGHADAGASVRIEYLRGGEINVTDTRTQTSAEIARLRNSRLEDRNTGNRANQRQAVQNRSRQRSSALDGGAVSHWAELTFVSMTPELGQYFGAETGVLLVHCSEKDLPLMPGDVILKIGQQTPVDASQAVSLLQGYDPNETVVLEIWRYGRPILLEFAFNAPPPLDVQVAQNLR